MAMATFLFPVCVSLSTEPNGAQYLPQNKTDYYDHESLGMWSI